MILILFILGYFTILDPVCCTSFRVSCHPELTAARNAMVDFRAVCESLRNLLVAHHVPARLGYIDESRVTPYRTYMNPDLKEIRDMQTEMDFWQLVLERDAMPQIPRFLLDPYLRLIEGISIAVRKAANACERRVRAAPLIWDF